MIDVNLDDHLTRFRGDGFRRPGHRSRVLPPADREPRPAGDPGRVGRAIAYAIEQPAEVDLDEIVIRPTAQV
jgi:hypothetical protein